MKKDAVQQLENVISVTCAHKDVNKNIMDSKSLINRSVNVLQAKHKQPAVGFIGY